VLAFVIAVWASFLVSRFVRFVLAEEVYPHARLKRGLPYAISQTLHDVILVIGFFVATVFLPEGYTIIPIFELVNRLGLAETLWGVILAESGGAHVVTILLFAGFFSQLPKELEEAARTCADEANHLAALRVLRGLPAAQGPFVTGAL